jgi:hypothetical protein
MAKYGQLSAVNLTSLASSLPARHPILRDSAVILAIVSTICYFAFSEGVRSFAGFLAKIASRIVPALH